MTAPTVLLVAWLSVVLLLGAVARNPTPRASTMPALSAPVVQASPQPAAAVSGTYFDYVVIIVMEDHAICDILQGGLDGCAGGAGPYETTLANGSGLATRYSDCGSPSLPNYLCLTGASTFGCAGYDGDPHSNACTRTAWSATNIVDLLVGRGLTWQAFMEDMPSSCYGSNSGGYAVSHNPFLYYQDIARSATQCNRVVPAGTGDSALLNALASTANASNYMWLTPNLCNAMHDCSVATGDTYLKGLVPKILSSTVFRTTRAALFITFDEDHSGNGAPSLYTVWSGPVAKTGYTSSNAYNPFSLLKTLEVNWGLASLTSNDGNAASMTEFFGTASPDFSMSASPSSVSFVAGQTATSTISVHATGGFKGTVSLSGSSTPSGVTTSFSPSSITPSQTSTCTMSATAAGSYTVTVTGTSGSLVRTTAISVTVAARLTANFTFAPTSPISGQAVNFTGTASGGTSPYTYAWQFGDGTTGSGANISHPFLQAGTYAVNLTVTDSRARTATATHAVTVASSPSPPPPTVATNAASGIGQTSATLHGDLASLGGASSVSFGFLYGTSPTLTGASNWTVGSASTPAPFSGAVSGLSRNTTYYCEAWASGRGFSNGGILPFTTLAPPSPPLSPTALLHVQGTAGNHGWYVSHANLSFTAVDPHGRASWVVFGVDGGPFVNFTLPVVLGDGVHVVAYYAADAYGAPPGSMQYVNLSVDTTPPQLSVEIPDAIVTTPIFLVRWNGSDNLSGIASYAVQIDGASFWPAGLATGETLSLPDGSHTIAVRATDGAGNQVTKTASVQVDTHGSGQNGPDAGLPTYATLLAAVAAAVFVLWRRRRRSRSPPPPGQGPA